MGRPPSIDEDEVIARLAKVFSDVGYDGASLAQLAEASGLKKASLYHRFPGGKKQMAEDVLTAALDWIAANVLAPLDGYGPPRERIALAAENLNTFYRGGHRACLLNMLSSPRNEDGPFGKAIREAFEALLAAFSGVARAAGASEADARARAERAVVTMQGSLVLSRGIGSTGPFGRFLDELPDILAAEAGPARSRKVQQP